MANTTANETKQSFRDYWSAFARRKLYGGTTFRHPQRSPAIRGLTTVLYPIAVLQVLLSPIVIVGLATIFDPLTRYFHIITALLAYALTALLAWIAVYNLILT